MKQLLINTQMSVLEKAINDKISENISLALLINLSKVWEFQVTEDYIICGSDCNLELILKYSHEEKIEVPPLMIKDKDCVLWLDGTHRMLSRLVRKDESVLVNTFTEEQLKAYTRVKC